MLSFKKVYITARVRTFLKGIVQPARLRQFFQMIANLQKGRFDLHGLNVEKLAAAGNLYSARVNQDWRAIFSMQQSGVENSESLLLIHELNQHDRAYDWVRRRGGKVQALAAGQEELDILEEAFDPESGLESSSRMEFSLPPDNRQFYSLPDYILENPERYPHFERAADRFLVLSSQQEEILKLRQKALLIQGTAGSGKTVMLLFAALGLIEENPEDHVYFFTYQKNLARVCQDYQHNMYGADQETESESGIRVFSYIEFCQRYLKEALTETEKGLKWIDRDESIRILSGILKQKPRWQRSYDSAELWGLIYSILKGRFMPGTEILPSSTQDYERIFRDYGRMPEDLTEILDIFSIYQKQLELRSCLDEADLIRLSFEAIRRGSLLSSLRSRLWILIDEMQDFSELEWKSILLLWEKHLERFQTQALSFPFLTGDINQNISRSGFRWQELETYLQSVLKKLHRPNALEKHILLQSYRNTLQIQQLAAFLRECAEPGVLLPSPSGPAASLPALVIAGLKSFESLLDKYLQDEDKSNPLVVLVEDDLSLDYLRGKYAAHADSLFLLSLRESKGLEFEDVIILRAFSTLKLDRSETGVFSALESRCFDLWYMGITRARSNLLIFVEAKDFEALSVLLKEKFSELLELVRKVDEQDAEAAFASFIAEREQDCSDNSVIFLQLRYAHDLFGRYIRELESVQSDNSKLSVPARHAAQTALAIWAKCHDYKSLAQAHKRLSNSLQAAIFYRRAGLELEAAACFEQSGNFLEAARSFEIAGHKKDAARNYEAASDFLKAAELHVEMQSSLLAAENFLKANKLAAAAGSFETAQDFIRAAELYEQLHDYKKAGTLFEISGAYERAAASFLKSGQYLEAALNFRQAGLFADSLRLFQSLGLSIEAAESAEQQGLYELSARLFQKGSDFHSAARNFERAELFEEAAESFKKAGDYCLAGSCFEQSGNLEESACMYFAGSDFEKALTLASSIPSGRVLQAECLQKLSRFEEASEIFLELDLKDRAALCFESCSEFGKAARIYLELGNSSQAANCLSRSGESFAAACEYLKISQTAQAYDLVNSRQRRERKTAGAVSDFTRLVDWCVESGLLLAAARLLELDKNFLAAAEKYKECLNFRSAADCLQKSGRLIEAAELYRDSGEHEKAANCFMHSKRWRQAGFSYEQIGKWSDALRMYERCQDSDGIERCRSALNWF